MHHVVRYSLLLINICFRSPSSATMLKDTVTVLKEAAGKDITILCATDKSPQDGVYMYKQDETEKKQLFYFYKDGKFTPKNLTNGKVILSGTLPNLNATFLNLTGRDIGLYWCEFNLEDKIKHSCATWLYVTETTVEKECPENPENYYMMILLIGCVIIFLLCLITFFCVILKVKRSFEYKKYTSSIQHSDPEYVEMKRSNLDSQPTPKTFINPEYQSASKLRNK